jgi:endonuclease/exonuclease/phosphatase (EEP) superfamily protein YafD
MWFIRILDFPRVQISFLLIISLIATLIFIDRKKISKWILVLLLTASLTYQLTLIYDYTFLAEKEVADKIPAADEKTVSFLISNVFMKNDNYGGFLDLIRNYKPDIIIVLEPDRKWKEKLEVLKNKYSFYLEYPLENTYGMILYSTLELIEPQVRFLIKKDIPSIHARLKLESGKVFRLYAVHPEPPVPGESADSKERDAELILIAREIRKIEEPVIVAGDLNDVAWSHTTRLFQRISGLLDPRIGRGFYNTYNAKLPLLRWPLDHVFHSNHFKLVELKTLPNFNSDHFPVYVKLNYEIEAAFQQKEKSPQKGDLEEARETINEAR